MMVCANQLVRSSGPSTVSLKSFCALIWSSQLIGGINSSVPRAAFLNASVTSASAHHPDVLPYFCYRRAFSADQPAGAISNGLDRPRVLSRRRPCQGGSIWRETRGLDHARPLVDILVQIRLELGRAHGQRHCA